MDTSAVVLLLWWALTIFTLAEATIPAKILAANLKWAWPWDWWWSWWWLNVAAAILGSVSVVPTL